LSKKSNHVITWRRRTKERLVKAFDNKCAICRKSFPQEVFDFHHVNPEEKKFGLGTIRSNCISWEKIVVEIRKCVMLCANCHRLVENGYVTVPENAQRFNEKYTNYKLNEITKPKYDRCICGRKKLVTQKYCSRKCYNEHRKKVDWPSKNELETLLYDKGLSLNKIGKMFGVTHAAVKRWKKNYKIGF